MTIQMQIHKRALEIVGNFKKAEADLIDIMQKADEHKVYLGFECKNLHEYSMKVLKLSESIAFNFIVVARKAKEVPELKAIIQSGALSVSKARKITPVLTKTNQKEWLQMAVDLPQKKLKRAQDLESQRGQKPATLEDTLEAALDLYLKSQDPVAKAETLKTRKNLAVARQVDLRDYGQCTFRDSSGQRCHEKRWLHIHHIIPKSRGGPDTLENLTTLCSGHHRLIHSPVFVGGGTL